jgi:hypothetical protein
VLYAATQLPLIGLLWAELRQSPSRLATEKMTSRQR